MKIAISIPIHEAIDVACDQANNLNAYIRNPVIIFHASKALESNEQLKELAKKKNVIVNPVHLKTDWGNIVEAHISNFKYLDMHTDFDYFMMHSSNDMYVRTGVDDYLSQYEAGFNFRKIDDVDSLWVVAAPAREDRVLQRLCGGETAYASQIEGSFYARNLMRKIVNRLETEMPFEETEVLYTREELFFSSIAAAFVEEDKVGRPTTFSEVHRFDRIFQKYSKTSNRIFCEQDSRFRTILDDLFRRVLFRSKIYAITRKDVDEIRGRNVSYIQKNGIVDDGQGKIYLYDGANVFSVKRVPRSTNNRLRKYINQLKVER